jgi:hypothetical protein
MTFQELAGPEKVNLFTHRIVGTANDLSQATVTTAQAFNFAIPLGATINQVELRLIIPFQNTADAAFISDTVSVGDTSLATKWVSAVECNLNGAYITTPQFSATLGGPYAANQNIVVTFNAPTAGKALANINRGELHIYVQIQNPAALSSMQLATPPSKP